MRFFDVAILGTGLLGCFAARHLADRGYSVAVLERENDMCMGMSRANTAVVYAGYDMKPGTLKAQFTVKGNAAFDDLCKYLGVSFKRTGSLMVAQGPRGEATLREKYLQGRLNGVPDLRMLGFEEIKLLEPGLSPKIRTALYSPTTGTVNPWELSIAAAHCAVHRGADFFFEHEVNAISRITDESSDSRYHLCCKNGTAFGVRAVINCTGVNAAEVSDLVAPTNFTLELSSGSYLILDTEAYDSPRHIIFSESEEKHKGATLVPTVDGTLMLGPSHEDLDEPVNRMPPFMTTAKGLDFVRHTSVSVYPNLPLQRVIRSFGTLRPRIKWAHRLSDGKVALSTESISDLHIAWAEKCPGFLNMAGIKTPGLTCADVIGSYAADLVDSYFSEQLPSQKLSTSVATFDRISSELLAEKRKSPDTCTTRAEEERIRWSDDEIICRCRQITVGEVRCAINDELGARTVDGVKRRVGCGLGRCQGGFCMERVMLILAQELGCEPSDIIKDRHGSWIIRKRPTAEPSYTERIPNNGVPIHSDSTPDQLDSVSVLSNNMPDRLNSVPVLSNRIPDRIDSVPITLNNMPEQTGSVPVTLNSKHDQSDSVPVLSNRMPDQSDSVPVLSNRKHDQSDSVPVLLSGSHAVAKPDLEKVRLLVVGAGAAGLVAASTAVESGLSPDEVLLIDRLDELGGILPQCTHHGFGMHEHGGTLSGSEFLSPYLEKFNRSRVPVLLNTTATHIDSDRTVSLAGKYGLDSLQPEALIFAAGCRERTLGSLPVAGTRPSGIFTAGAAQRMVNLHKWDIGERIVILGGGDVGMIMAGVFAEQGKNVIAVVEQDADVGGLKANRERYLDARGIPVFTGCTVKEVFGRKRIEGIEIEVGVSSEATYGQSHFPQKVQGDSSPVLGQSIDQSYQRRIRQDLHLSLQQDLTQDIKQDLKLDQMQDLKQSSIQGLIQGSKQGLKQDSKQDSNIGCADNAAQSSNTSSNSSSVSGVSASESSLSSPQQVFRSVLSVSKGTQKDQSFFLECDTLIVSIGLISEVDLLQTILPDVSSPSSKAPSWLFLAGNARRVHSFIEGVVIDGKNAGRQAAQFLGVG